VVYSIVSKIFLSKLGSAKLKESLIFAMSYLQLTVPWVLVEIKLQEMDWIRHGNFVKLTTSPMMVLLCATGTALNLLGNGQPGKLAFAQCSGLGCWGTPRFLKILFESCFGLLISLLRFHTGLISSKSFQITTLKACITLILSLFIHNKSIKVISGFNLINVKNSLWYLHYWPTPRDPRDVKRSAIIHKTCYWRFGLLRLTPKLKKNRKSFWKQDFLTIFFSIFKVFLRFLD
jgi:hypothetical protein